ncbi:hypothetical protein FRB95_012270 [Tulasnella sp. JGI-2019a]|nr:hypothetical protein FRB95_012270 [Tulasnella sp. JGI-2019a]
MRSITAISLVSLCNSIFATGTAAQALNATLLGLVRARMSDSALLSWEAGTRAETILEVDFPKLSVFGSDYLSTDPPYTTTALEPLLSIARTAVNNRAEGSEQLWGAGTSAGDPASLGVAVLLGNWTNASGAVYSQAAQQQLDLLMTGTPRVASGLAAGAISHRADSVALWSDFMYMVPPFLAYYGAVTQNASLILESYNQISLYRDALFSPNVSLWQHIYCPGAYSSSVNNFNDTGHWATGNGWAAAGMLRVLATMKNSPWSSQFQTQQTDLSNWITEIHTGMTNVLPTSGIFNNYVDVADGVRVPSLPKGDHATNFPDASGTAIFAATVYRHITLSNPGSYDKILATAEKVRGALYATNGTTHFDANGWLTPVVDPHQFAQAGNCSDEAQSFVLQLDNNWKAWAATEGKSSVSGGLTGAVDNSGNSDNSATSGGGRGQGGLVAVTPKVVAAALCAGVMISAWDGLVEDLAEWGIMNALA